MQVFSSFRSSLFALVLLALSEDASESPTSESEARLNLTLAED